MAWCGVWQKAIAGRTESTQQNASRNGDDEPSDQNKSSPPVSEHLFVARKDLPQETIDTLRQAMFQLKDEIVLTSIKNSVTGLVPVKIEDYDYLFSVMRELNKLTTE